MGRISSAWMSNCPMAIVPGGRGEGWVVFALCWCFSCWDLLAVPREASHCKAHPASEEQEELGRWAWVQCRVFATRPYHLVCLGVRRGGIPVLGPPEAIGSQGCTPWKLPFLPCRLQPQRHHLSRAMRDLRKITIKKSYVRSICEIIRARGWSCFHLGALC